MNKYEKALLRLDKSYKLSAELRHDACGVLLKSVERATPNKPIKVNYGYECPNCRNEVYNVSFCQDCGKTLLLDWSDSK